MTMNNTVTYTRPADVEAIMMEARRLRAEALKRWSIAGVRWARKKLQATPQPTAA